jgi:hypothetical protein
MLYTCVRHVLRRDLFTIRIENELHQIVKINTLTWIKIVKYPVLQRGVYNDYCVRCFSILKQICLLAGLLNYSSTLKMEAIRSSETSGTTQRTTRRHIPEEDTLQ